MSVSKKIQSSTSSIGARSLEKTLVRITMPTYDKILDHINHFRTQARNYRNEQSFDIKPEFVNTITILGDRGTGKTSVLHTLHREIQNMHINDIVTAMIVPEKMSSVSDTLGWILNSLKLVVDNINERYSEFLFHKREREWAHHQRVNRYDTTDSLANCIKKEELNPLLLAYKTAEKQYHIRKEYYRDAIVQRDEGILGFVADNQKMINADLELIDSFHCFLDAIIKAKMDLDNPPEDPLIFIFLDDVDLCAERTGEVLETVLNFLTHSHLVSVVTGDYKVFSEAITLHLLQKENISNPQFFQTKLTGAHLEDPSHDNTVLGIRQERSEELLKKALPPSYRHRMALLNDNEKWSFTGYELDGTVMRELFADIGFKGKRFGDVWGEPEPEYAKFLDLTPRGCINVYQFLQQRRHGDWDGDDVKQLLWLLVNSSRGLRKFSSLIEKAFRIYASHLDRSLNAKDSYIDYDLIFVHKESQSEVYCEKTKNQPNIGAELEAQLFDEFYTIMLLGDFFEKLFQLRDASYNLVKNRMVNYLNRINKNYKLFPDIQDTSRLHDFFLQLTQRIGLKDVGGLFANGKINESEIEYIHLLPVLTDNVKIEGNLSNTLRKIYTEDVDWVRQQIEILFKNWVNLQEMQHQLVNKLKEKIGEHSLGPLNWRDLEQEIYEQLNIKGFRDKFYSFADQRSLFLVNSFEKIQFNIKSSNLVEKGRIRGKMISPIVQQISLIDDRLDLDISFIDKLIQRDQLINEKIADSNEIPNVEGKLEVIRQELKNADPESIIRRKRVLERITVQQEYIKSRQEEWDNLTSSFLNSESMINSVIRKPNEYTVTFDPWPILGKFLPPRDVEAHKRAEDVQEIHYVYKGLMKLDSATQQFLHNYFNALEEVKLLNQIKPLDVEARQKELDQLEQKQNEIRKKLEQSDLELKRLRKAIQEDLEQDMTELIESDEILELIRSTINDNRNAYTKILRESIDEMKHNMVSIIVNSYKNILDFHYNIIFEKEEPPFSEEKIKEIQDIYEGVLEEQLEYLATGEQMVILDERLIRNLQTLRRIGGSFNKRLADSISFIHHNLKEIPYEEYVDRLNQIKFSVQDRQLSDSSAQQRIDILVSSLSIFQTRRVPNSTRIQLYHQAAIHIIQSIASSYIMYTLLTILQTMDDRSAEAAMHAYREQLYLYYQENKFYRDGFTRYIGKHIKEAMREN
ncbi:hypothetical protein GC098_21695 [Paenibacillus sp. LMG 31458]|uniref:AAA+ ATPase domain-containing protein n=1 Tax=Paenibacillus phytorum TaxID=2654977 RepID=A0ABX1XZH7_9BACL|nr:hypothetical protein [Paenibacillus phytorum]NOU73980.1 hypothetical protein [Paenibacillus phytorum]